MPVGWIVNCYVGQPSFDACDGHTAALWTLPYGPTIGLCWRHLNAWLDAADDDPEREPARLEFLDPPVSSGLAQWRWWSHDGGAEPIGQIKIRQEAAA